MNIGIIGAGNIGGTLARLWAEAGHQVMISSRHPEELEKGHENISVGTAREAAAFGEVILLAIPLKGFEEVVVQAGEELSGKTVIDAMNPFPGRDGEIARKLIDEGIPSGVATQNRLKDSTVIRAFSSVYFKTLQTKGHRKTQKIAIPIAGDDKEEKKVAESLVRDAGFEPFDLGLLSESAPLDPDGELFTKELTATEMKKLLS